MKWIALLVAVSSCQTPGNPGREGAYVITGRELTEAEETNLRDRVAAAYACGRRLGHRPTRHVSEIRIGRRCTGGMLLFPVAHVDYCTHSAQHEVLAAAFGHDASHPKNSVVIQCEHAGPKPFPCECPDAR